MNKIYFELLYKFLMQLKTLFHLMMFLPIPLIINLKDSSFGGMILCQEILNR